MDESQRFPDWRGRFGDFEGRAWLNCAHQGPLPLAAADAAREAVEWKLSPRRMTQERFDRVPRELKNRLGRLVGLPADEIILTNGASYGLHLLANGLPLQSGDEVLLCEGDFPSNILPWLTRRSDGVEIRIVRPARHVLSVDEVAANLSPRTRAVCLSWVHSFSGYVTDIDSIGELCRQAGAAFVVNTTQGLGARPLDLARAPVDAVANAGWKWLCGPYGTGFCWIRPELRERLAERQNYWLSILSAENLGQPELDLEQRPAVASSRYDLFATANFFNFHPWCASLDLLLDAGLERIERHDRFLVDRLLAGLDRERFDLLSPEPNGQRSTLVFVSHRDTQRNLEVYERLRERGVDAAFRRGSLRFSPHLYNTGDDVDRALDALHD